MPRTRSLSVIAIGAAAAKVAVSIFTSRPSAVRPIRVAAWAEEMPRKRASKDAPPRRVILDFMVLGFPVCEACDEHSLNGTSPHLNASSH